MEIISSKSFCEILNKSRMTFYLWKKNKKIKTIKIKGKRNDFVIINKKVEQLIKKTLKGVENE